MGLLCCSPRELRGAQSRMEALAIVPASENALRLRGRGRSATRATRVRLDKERASGHVDTSSYHIWKLTKPRGAVSA